MKRFYTHVKMSVGYGSGEWRVTQSDDEPADLADRTAARHREHELVEHLPDGVSLLDSAGSITWANERLHSWCGQGDLRGRDFLGSLAGWATLVRISLTF